MIEILTEGLNYPEGPVSLPDGRLLICEVQSGTLSVINPDGSFQRSPQLAPTCNGAAVGPDGLLYVCDNGGFTWHREENLIFPIGAAKNYQTGALLRVDLRDWGVETLLTEVGTRGLSGPNDIVFDSHGGCYFTDLGKVFETTQVRGQICYLAPSGESWQVASPILMPNGIGLDREEQSLIYAETPSGRLWKWEIKSPGVVSASKPSYFGQVKSPARIDSFAIDSEGNVLAAALDTGALDVISPSGELLHRFDFPGEPMVTNAAFSISDLNLIYVTLGASGRVATAKWDIPGFVLPHAEKVLV